MRICKPRDHKNIDSSSFKKGLSVDRNNDTKQMDIVSLGAFLEGWNTLQTHVVGYRMTKNMLADGESL
ncbi:Transposase Tn5 dimerisation domain [Shewanella putrefaciens]|uniref:hypothetical protein n=1 Tax=Shewanella putrefaciens TaxID=24 RepID=UPI000DFDD3F9|nr:hypothetical protein [Shewanella putrefaciens]SUJ07361.1 Transposase Tn5 dimerisation domain [Shewanella putrefaciens]